MDNFLINKWNGYNFGVNFNTLLGLHGTDGWVSNAYFFMERELSYTTRPEWYRAKACGLIRHVKPYDGMWLDYVANKKFSSLEEWAIDCGMTLSDVVYGVNRVHRGEQPKFVRLAYLLHKLDYVEPPTVDDSFTHILLDVLKATKSVPEEGQRCLVKRPDGSIVISRVVDLRFRDIEDGPVKLAVDMPMNNEGWCRTYTNLSDLPKDTVVYLRTTDGEFVSIRDLMS